MRKKGMSEKAQDFLPVEQAAAIVGAIQEEEHIHEHNRRIFTVYDKHDRELCWFDAEDTIAAAAPGPDSSKKELLQPKVEEYILTHLPRWVLD
jgi:hypothetical protein